MKRNLIALGLALAAAVLFVPCCVAAGSPSPAPSLGPAPAAAAPSPATPAAQAAPEVMSRILDGSAPLAPLQFQCPQLPPTCCVAWNGHCRYCTGYTCDLQ